MANFNGLIGIYFLEIGERDLAENYFDLLKQIAPEYPMTKLLRRKLYPGFFKRMFRRLAGQTKSIEHDRKE